MHEPNFDWDDAKFEHIAGHSVEPTEAEDALLDPVRAPSTSRSTPTERRRGVLGMTQGGRILFVSYTLRRGAVRLVTAYDASDRQKRQHRRRRRSAVRHRPKHDPSRWPKERIVVHSWDEVPQFASECEEQEFWSTHEMGDQFFENVEPDADAELPPPRARTAPARGP